MKRADGPGRQVPAMADVLAALGAQGRAVAGVGADLAESATEAGGGAVPSGGMDFYRRLVGLMRPQRPPDKLAMRWVRNWLAAQVEAGRYNEKIWGYVLDLAVESAGPACRNRFAVFQSLLRRELGYTTQAGRISGSQTATAS
ncbi:MAG TPA: hypothetical protein ENN81_02135 [Phycisphaerales bacterium]|nr:hypothetical protein [Phycisphaerales bacterium]